MPKKTAHNSSENGVRQQRLPFFWDEVPASASQMLPAQDQAPATSSSERSPEVNTPDEPTPPLPTRPPPSDIALEGDTAPQFESGEDGEEEDIEKELVEDEWDSEGGDEDEDEDIVSANTEYTPSPKIVELEDHTASVGQALLEARATAGLTVSEVAQRTYLSKAAIEHIETGQYELIPTPSHCRSYIEKLCGAYDIPAGALLERFADEYEAAVSSGGMDVLSGFVSQDRESGAMLSPRPRGTALPTHAPRPLNFTGIAMSIIIGAFVLLVAGAIVTQHLRNRRQQIEPLPADLPPVELQEFVVPQELRLDELPIPTE